MALLITCFTRQASIDLSICVFPLFTYIYVYRIFGAQLRVRQMAYIVFVDFKTSILKKKKLEQ